MTKVLIIDDDQYLSSTLATGLRSLGFVVIQSFNAPAGLYAMTNESPDVVLLDITLAEQNGLQVIQEARPQTTVPIIVLSAIDNEQVKIKALELGADDYVTKPFSLNELVARIRAAVRRGVRADGTTVIEAGSLTIDLIAKSVTRQDVRVKLTATEWRLMELLIARDGQLVSYDDLLDGVWKHSRKPSMDYLRVYVAAIRRKIEDNPTEPRYIITEAGQGYRFVR